MVSKLEKQAVRFGLAGFELSCFLQPGKKGGTCGNGGDVSKGNGRDGAKDVRISDNNNNYNKTMLIIIITMIMIQKTVLLRWPLLLLVTANK